MTPVQAAAAAVIPYLLGALAGVACAGTAFWLALRWWASNAPEACPFCDVWTDADDLDAVDLVDNDGLAWHTITGGDDQ